MAVTATLRRPNVAGSGIPPKGPIDKAAQAQADFAAGLGIVKTEKRVVETPVKGVEIETTDTHTTSDATEAGDRADADAREAAENAEAAEALQRSNPAEYEPGHKPTLSPARRDGVVLGAYHAASDGGLEGEFDTDDLKLPQLKIVNGSGPLSQEFNQGSLLYAGEMLWEPPDLKHLDKNPIMRFVPIKITKQWRENLTEEENDAQIMPRIVSTRAEAERLGGSTRWVNDEKPRWSPSARCLFLLEEREGTAHPAFASVLDGKNYAPCVYYASGMGYNESVKQIIQASHIALKDVSGKIMLHKRFWTWQVKKAVGGKYTVFVPVLRLLREDTGPEIRALALTMGGTAPAGAGDE